MNSKYIEEIYNNISYSTKEDIGFPSLFIYLTTEQEQFIMELFNNKTSVKKDLLEMVEEMREIINDI